MSALSDNMNAAEKKTLGRLAAAACLFLALGGTLAIKQRNAYYGAREEIARSEAQGGKTGSAVEQAKKEWRRWQDAHRDLESFRDSYFYEAKASIPALMQDIRRIFNQAAADVSQIAYDYGEMAKGQIGRIGVTFNYRGGYADFKRLLSIIEHFPRFLAVEKIDFLSTGSDGGPLSLKISMAGYYEI